MDAVGHVISMNQNSFQAQRAFKHSRTKEITMALPTSKQTTSGGEFTPFDPGTYQVALKRIDLDIFKEYETDSFNNGDGLRYQGCTFVWDIDGDEYRERFVKVSTNERAKFFNRVSALLGRDLTDDDQLDWQINPRATTNAEFDSYFRPNDHVYEAEDGNERGTYKVEEAKVDEGGKPVIKYENGKWVHRGHENDGISGALDDLKINGESLYGKACFLVLKVNKKGYNACDAGAASPLPKGGRRAQPIPAGMPT
jgi:hypothetical protein